MRAWKGLVAAVSMLVALPAVAAPCPNVTIAVDNDVPGSGYSEEKPENWQTGSVNACGKTYRYLSKHVGDLSSKGKAIWKPAIAVSGWYQVTTSYRATVNRTNDADYFVYDDLGGVHHEVVNQAGETNCTHHDLGTIYCAAGGACRVVLDGTDDGKSDAADVTTWKLTSCDGPDAGPAPGACEAIAAHADWEVCFAGAETCAGTFNDGAGCVAYCAAAGMECVARFGGSPGCSKETGEIACAADNGHVSDWCECALPAPPPPVDAGAAGGAGGSTGTTTVIGEGGFGVGGGVVTTSSGGSGGATMTTETATTSPAPSGGAGGQGTMASAPSSCACGVAGQGRGSSAALAILALLGLCRRRARYRVSTRLD